MTKNTKILVLVNMFFLIGMVWVTCMEDTGDESTDERSEQSISSTESTSSQATEQTSSVISSSTGARSSFSVSNSTSSQTLVVRWDVNVTPIATNTQQTTTLGRMIFDLSLTQSERPLTETEEELLAFLQDHRSTGGRQAVEDPLYVKEAQGYKNGYNGAGNVVDQLNFKKDIYEQSGQVLFETEWTIVL